MKPTRVAFPWFLLAGYVCWAVTGFIAGYYVAPDYRPALTDCRVTRDACQNTLNGAVLRYEAAAQDLRHCAGVVGIKHTLMVWYRDQCTRFCFDKNGERTRK